MAVGRVVGGIGAGHEDLHLREKCGEELWVGKS